VTAAVLELGLLVSGLALAAFMLGHEAMLASVWAGAASMNRLARFLEGTRLVGPGVVAVATLLLVHAVLAVRRLPWRWTEAKAYARKAGSLLHWDTVSWALQAATALVVGVLVAIHLWTAGGDLPVQAAKSAGRVARLAGTGFYDVLLSAAALHAALGLERIATKWGPFRRTAARRLAWLVLAGLLLAGFGTLIAFDRLAGGR